MRCVFLILFPPVLSPSDTRIVIPVYTDISYGKGEANKFDLYVPADNSKASYGLVVYLHAGGFATGDKADDKEMLQWLCSLGYVSAGINYTLFNDDHPDASVYSQSMEIKEAMLYVVDKAKKLGYNVDRMAVSGGSAGGCLALIYGLRDADTSPIPVKMIFEADIHLLYGTSTRDGDLAKVQNFFQNGIMDVDESVADVYQQTLKESIPQFKEIGVSLFIWDGIGYYDDPRNMTSHTIIAAPVVWVPFESQNKSVAEWLTDAINGTLNDYGVELVDKVYEKTE